jgi:hypothetical protein
MVQTAGRSTESRRIRWIQLGSDRRGRCLEIRETLQQSMKEHTVNLYSGNTHRRSRKKRVSTSGSISSIGRVVSVSQGIFLQGCMRTPLSTRLCPEKSQRTLRAPKEFESNAMRSFLLRGRLKGSSPIEDPSQRERASQEESHPSRRVGRGKT